MLVNGKMRIFKNKNMSSKNVLLMLSWMASLLLLISNSTGVPQAVSKAPGEANNNSCATCHSPARSFNPQISLEVLDSDSNLVTSYLPTEKYRVTVRVEGENSPRGFGFQMVALDSLTNGDRGIWSNFGDRVRQINLSPMGNARRYVTQSSVSNTGVFSMDWTAPNDNIGPITFYYTGLAVNLNRSTSGDDNIFANSTLQPQSPSSINQTSDNFVKIYPNPTQNYINIEGISEGIVRIINTMGQALTQTFQEGMTIDISRLNPGLYRLEILNVEQKSIHSQSLIKL